MVYGYARVSTAGQAKDGNSLETQQKILKDNGAVIIYSDKFTGKTTDRPELNKLLNALHEDDTLIVTKLDRIARSITEGSNLVSELINRKVRINILNIGVMDNTSISKLIRNIFFSFAEFERDMIIERTQEGKAIAKTNAGFKEGRPNKFTPEQILHALSLLETNSYKEVEKMTRVSKSTLVRAKNKMRANSL